MSTLEGLKTPESNNTAIMLLETGEPRLRIAPKQGGCIS